MRVKNCAYVRSVATLLNPRGVTTVSHKYSLTVARHVTVVVAVPSTVHYPPIIKLLFKMKTLNVNKLFTLKMHHKLRQVPSYERSRVSSGSIVSDYGLDDRAIGVRSPAGAKDFSSIFLCPDRLWGPPSLLYNVYRGSFPRG
jgi:hypothetical protein